jgi:hypothetical protein
MERLLPNISEWFKGKEYWFRAFAKHDSRVEGWFKGELLVCLEKLKEEGRVDDFEREFTPGRKGWGEKGQHKIDFKIRIDGQNHLCELKAMCISQALGTSRSLSFYFRPQESNVLAKDFSKLSSLKIQCDSWIVSFVYPSPSPKDWAIALEKWRKVIADWRCVTDPGSYPEWFFLACWHLEKNRGQGELTHRSRNN